MKAMKIFTFSDGKYADGARIQSFQLAGAGIQIPAITIGEDGRGRKQGILPVHLTKEQHQRWKNNEEVRVYFGYIGETRNGNPKLFATDQPATEDQALLVLRTHIGYRGGNYHTGEANTQGLYTLDIDEDFKETIQIFERIGYKNGDVATFEEMMEAEKKYVEYKQFSKEYGETFIRSLTDKTVYSPIIRHFTLYPFNPFPCDIIVEGKIAQGAAGRMGSGDQYIVIVAKNTVFRTAYDGRLYGDPNEHFHMFDGEKMLCLTKQQREVSDLF